jgi:hypothetical protein
MARIVSRTALAVAAISVVLSASGPAQEKQDKQDKKEQKGAKVLGWVCPMYKAFENPGQYCCYYALECSDSTTPPCAAKSVPYYHSNCQLSPGNCCTTNNCFEIPMLQLRKKPAHVDKGLKNGIPEPHPDTFVPTPQNGSTTLAPYIAQIPTPGGNDLKVKLFHTVALKAGHVPRMIGHGVEVTTKKKPERIFDAKDLSFDGKICYISVLGTDYVVFLSTDPEAKP